MATTILYRLNKQLGPLLKYCKGGATILLFLRHWSGRIYHAVQYCRLSPIWGTECCMSVFNYLFYCSRKNTFSVVYQNWNHNMTCSMHQATNETLGMRTSRISHKKWWSEKVELNLKWKHLITKEENDNTTHKDIKYGLRQRNAKSRMLEIKAGNQIWKSIRNSKINCQEYICLELTFDSSGTNWKEIEKWIIQAKKFPSSINRLLWSKEITKKWKFHKHETLITTTSLYESERSNVERDKKIIIPWLRDEEIKERMGI